MQYTYLQKGAKRRGERERKRARREVNNHSASDASIKKEERQSLSSYKWLRIKFIKNFKFHLIVTLLIIPFTQLTDLHAVYMHVNHISCKSYNHIHACLSLVKIVKGEAFSYHNSIWIIVFLIVQFKMLSRLILCFSNTTWSGSGLQVPILPVGLNAVTLSAERREENKKREGRDIYKIVCHNL